MLLKPNTEQLMLKNGLVLTAFGVVDHNDPMTVSEAKANTIKYDPNRWTPVYEQLLILEAADV